MKNLIKQLTDVYLNEELYNESWQRTKLTREEADYYFQTLTDKERLFCCTNEGQLIGFVETWKLDYEQFGRIIAGEPFCPCTENIEEGEVAYVGDVWVHPDYRKGRTIHILKEAFKEMNRDCKYFVGEAKRKACQPIKVMKRKDIFK